MKIKEVFSLSYSKYRAHKISSWVLGLFFALLSGAILFIDFVLSGLSLFTIPLVILPLLFSIIINHKRLLIEDRITMGDTFRYFALYFSRLFRGVFNFLLNLGKSLLLALGVFTASSGISYLIFNQSETFRTSIEEIAKKMSEGTLSNELYKEYLFANNNELLNYLLIAILPTIFLTSLFFFFLVSKSSISIFVKLDSPKLTSQFTHLALKRFIRDNRKEFYKCYFGTNFPIYVLFIGGLVLGSALSYGMYDHPLAPMSLGVASGLGLTALYFPFYLNNMEAIYETFTPQIHLYIAKTADEIMQRFAKLNAMREEDKQKIDEFLNSLKEKQAQESEPQEEDKEQ